MDRISRRTVSTHDRIRLSDRVIRDVPFNLDHFERLLVRHVVDFLTGSNMITTARFESAATVKLDEIERAQVRGMTDALLAIVADPDLPYTADVVVSDRLEKLLGILDELDARFDILECKSRIIKVLNDGHSSVRINNGYAFQELDAVMMYLIGADNDVPEWFLPMFERVETGGTPIHSPSRQRYRTILWEMLRAYPSVIKPERKARLNRVIDISWAHPVLGGSETFWRELISS